MRAQIGIADVSVHLETILADSELHMDETVFQALAALALGPRCLATQPDHTVRMVQRCRGSSTRYMHRPQIIYRLSSYAAFRPSAPRRYGFALCVVIAVAFLSRIAASPLYRFFHFFFLIIRPPPISPLFPSPTLSR